jgi:hypothetical protein
MTAPWIHWYKRGFTQPQDCKAQEPRPRDIVDVEYEETKDLQRIKGLEK